MVILFGLVKVFRKNKKKEWETCLTFCLKGYKCQSLFMFKAQHFFYCKYYLFMLRSIGQHHVDVSKPFEHFNKSEILISNVTYYNPKNCFIYYISLS